MSPSRFYPTMLCLLAGWAVVAWAAPADSVLEPSVEGSWRTETVPASAMTIAVPPGAHVRHGGLTSRHRGFDIVQVSSFELEDGHHAVHGVPRGEWIVHFAYEANSFDPAGELRDFVDRKLASLDYLPTGEEPVIGGRRFVELDGELGTLWITHQGWNVYSMMIYGGVDRAPRRLVEEMAASWRLEQEEPLYIAPEDHGRWASGLPTEIDTGGQRLPGQPYMKMPWSSTSKYRYTGGPHHPKYTGNGCSSVYNTNDMSGIDFGLPHGTEVLAVAPGTVREASDPGDGRGLFVRVEHDGYGIVSEYWHLAGTNVEEDDPVARGKVLGTSGTSGVAHLHFELRYYPSLARYPMHGLSIDGYLVYALHPSSTWTQGFNYQGTLVRGSSYWQSTWHCSQYARKWFGSQQTITAGDSTKVTSTNSRIP